MAEEVQFSHSQLADLLHLDAMLREALEHCVEVIFVLGGRRGRGLMARLERRGGIPELSPGPGRYYSSRWTPPRLGQAGHIISNMDRFISFLFRILL